MKTRYIYIWLLGLLSVLNTGCEDRLDIPKHGNMGSQEDFYQTDQEAIQALASLYFSWSSNYYNWFMTKNSCAPTLNCAGVSEGGQPPSLVRRKVLVVVSPESSSTLED